MSPKRSDKSAILEALLICLGVVILGYCPDATDNRTPQQGTAAFLPESGENQSELTKPPVTEPLPVEKAAEVSDHRQAVVRIVVAEGPSTSRGSGVLVMHDGRPLVLTAFHVVRGNRDRIKVHFQDGSDTKARVVTSDDAWDVAALECDSLGAIPATLAPQPKNGDTLAVAGYGPHPSTFREVAGRLVGRARPTRQHPSDHIVVSAGARQGDSGGPIFNEAGEVAGILWGSDGRDTYATHSGRLREILEVSNKNKLKVIEGAKDGPRSPCANGRCPKP